MSDHREHAEESRFWKSLRASSSVLYCRPSVTPNLFSGLSTTNY
jgi:hypothetical protein